TLSTLIDWKNRSTCVLFGDGAGAVVVRRTESQTHRIISIHLHSDGSLGELLCIPHGGSRVPAYSPEFRNDMAKIKMKGSEIFKLAVRSMIEVANKLLSENNLTPNDIDYFFFHQANMRIIDHCAKSLGIDLNKTW